MAMSCSRTVTKCQSHVYTRSLPSSVSLKVQCIRHFHPSIIPRSSKARTLVRAQATKRKSEERKAEKLAARKNPLPPQQQHSRYEPEEEPREQRMSAKEARKIVQFNNPKAKFVVTREMELRHLMYSERHVGEVLAIPDEIVGQLADLGMFNKNQGFQYMRRPVCMMRANTGLVARELFAQDVTHLGTKDRRVVVAGKGGNGKSFILLQMATLALLQNYVVVAVPRGMDLVENRIAFQEDDNTFIRGKRRSTVERVLRFRQDDYMAAMIGRTLRACTSVLENLTTTENHLIGDSRFRRGTPLVEILEDAELHPSSSLEVFEAFLAEMSVEGRPQVLFLFDNISAISVPTLYRNFRPPYDYLHPHRFWVPFFFTCLMNGTFQLPRAAVVTATSQFPVARTLEISLGQITQRPYEPIDRRIPYSVDGATVINAGDRLTPDEAMGLSSFYKDAGLLKIIDRFDGLSKSVGDEEYKYSDSKFFVFQGDGEDASAVERAPFAFRRKGRMSTGMVRNYLRRGGIGGKEDPTDFEATMERLALGGGTARGFWRACTRMAPI